MNTETNTDYSIDHYDRRNNGSVHRVPLIAALMSAALPGFGQLYNGQLNRAIWFFLAFCVLAIPLVTVIALFLPAALTAGVLACGLLLALGVWIWGIIDAWRVARRTQGYSLKPWQTTGLYTLVFLLCVGLVLPSMIRYVRNHQVQAFKTPSGSMMPTVQPGDFIFANKSYNCPDCRKSIRHGDVAIFVYPNNRNWYYIKRIIGMPGDTVSIEAGNVSVNGEPLGETVGNRATKTERYEGREWKVDAGGGIDDFSVEVKPGHVFVLGDNRTASNDSRVFGQVPLADVVGRARQIWFSKNEEGVQWGRVGESLIPVEGN